MARKTTIKTTSDKSISVIGMGPGNPELLTKEALTALSKAQLIIGARRIKEGLPKNIKAPFLSSIEPNEIKEVIKAADQTNIAVCVTGDTGFYSGAKNIIAALGSEYSIKIIPGLSSMSYLAAKLGISWQDACIVSSHGRCENWLGAVRSHEKTFLIMGQAPKEILARLCLCNLGQVVVVLGYMLSYNEEVILTGTAKGLLEEHGELETMNSSLCSMFILNPAPMDTPLVGINDDEFIKGRVPMTKAEVRAVAMSKLKVADGFTCFDIGAGCGSVSIEMAQTAFRGHVYSIERSAQALNVIRQNIEKFGADNITVVEGEAATALKDLPACDVAFIGGSRGQKKRIITELLEKNPTVRIVMNIITLESLAEILKLVKDYELINLEVVQVGVARSNLVKDQHLMEGQNPVYIVSCEGSGL